MYNYNALISPSPLFAGITPDEISAMLDCLMAREENFSKGEFIRRNGDKMDCLGIVLSGCVHIIKEDFWGNSNLIAQCLPGEIFGESYALNPKTPLEISIFAGQSCRILFLDISKILTICKNTCCFHSRLISNLLSILAEKNRMLNKKLEHVTKRNTREKLLSYLSGEADRQKSVSFDIPFNRQELADYLSVDRSAMSSALGALRDEGILTFRKNHFTLNPENASTKTI